MVGRLVCPALFLIGVMTVSTRGSQAVEKDNSVYPLGAVIASSRDGDTTLRFESVRHGHSEPQAVVVRRTYDEPGETLITKLGMGDTITIFLWMRSVENGAPREQEPVCVSVKFDSSSDLIEVVRSFHVCGSSLQAEKAP